MATTHYVKDGNRAYVDVLLTKVICGNFVTASQLHISLLVLLLLILGAGFFSMLTLIF